VIAAKVFGLLSAALGASGTLLLFFGSFAYEGFTRIPISRRSMSKPSATRGEDCSSEPGSDCSCSVSF